MTLELIQKTREWRQYCNQLIRDIRENTPDEIMLIVLDYLASSNVSIMSFPMSSNDLLKRLDYSRVISTQISLLQVQQVLEQLSSIWGQQLISLERQGNDLVILQINTTKIRKVLKVEHAAASSTRSSISPMPDFNSSQRENSLSKDNSEHDNLDALLSKNSFKEQQRHDQIDIISQALDIQTTKDQLMRQRFKSLDNRFQEFCEFGTKSDCSRERSTRSCSKVHFRRIIRPQTDPELGDCSYLNTCHRMDICKYMHYELDNPDVPFVLHQFPKVKPAAAFNPCEPPLLPQWINCDVRTFDYSVLGKFGVVMADPPWDIHMTLPYGTMTDDEMKAMPVPQLQQEGVIFLWVTGRAMELGRECLMEWGYERSDELVWVKTNQLQRLIRTGRTGHWLNHSKEHCLVGIKGNPSWLNRGMDTDVLVAEVRETSRKPDEIYGIIERLAPGQRKIEIFGRKHNTHPGWITLGNQLGDTRLVEPNVIERYNARYPNGISMPSRRL